MRQIKLKTQGEKGWHYGDQVKILKGMQELVGQTGRVIAAEGEYLRVKLDYPVYIKEVGIVKDDIWMPSTIRKLK